MLFRSRVAVPRWAIYAQAILLLITVMVCTTIGYRFGRTRSDLSTQTEWGPCEVSGRVMYAAEDGQALPDEGAVILLLPEDQRPTFEDKFSAIGLRSGDPAPGAGHAELAKVMQLGGAYGRADGQGEFQLKVPRGRYYVWVVSKHGQRAASLEFSRAELGQVSRYCIDPKEMVTDRKYRWLIETIARDRRLVIELD